MALKSKLSDDVNSFLDKMNHPLRKEIDVVRNIILTAVDLEENVKWNGPNYSQNRNDRITMRIQPPKQIQLVFHRGAKVLQQPKARLIDDETNRLDWKANDRAVVTLKTMEEIKSAKKDLAAIVARWVKAAE